MGKAIYWQKGATIDYTNSTTSTIPANTIINLNTRIGVAGTDIEVGAVGTVHVENVFILPKDSNEITLGAAVYYCVANDNITANKTTSSVANVLAGYAVEAAGASDTEVKVKLQG